MHIGKILVVNDSGTQRIIYRELLEGSGYSVIEAADGKEGLKKAKVESPDVIITNIKMPVMDGLEMTRVLKTGEATKYIPIICALETREGGATQLKALTEFGIEECFYLSQEKEELLVRIAAAMRIRKIYLELLEKNKQLKQFNDVAVGRELKMVELKEKIRILQEELAKYKK